MKFARTFALVALLAIAPAVSAQAPPTSTPAISGPAGTYFSAVSMSAPGPITFGGTWSGPAGTYAVTLPAGATVVQTANSITITWTSPTPAPLLAPAPAPVASPSIMHIPVR